MPASRPAAARPAPDATRYIWLSIGAAVLTIGLKLLAWRLSGSVGLLSDALESFVNLAGAVFALMMLRIAREPADEGHPFGHGKAEYFSSGFEGSLIFAAAGVILWTAWPRLLAPEALGELGIGLWLSAASAVVNLVVSLTLAKAARRLRSAALDADARHLMADVWTTGGVILALITVSITGWTLLDPLIAIGVALHILREGWRLMRGSANGLMDEALPAKDVAAIEALLAGYAQRDIRYSELKTRVAGHEHFVTVKIQVPGEWRVDDSHDLLDEIEARISAQLGGAQVTTHLEPRSG